MFKMIEKVRSRDEGFTLVELLVVVVILVVLAAIAVPIFLNQATKARDASAQSSIAAVANVIQNGESVQGTFTTTADEVAYTSPAGDQSVALGDVTVDSGTPGTKTWCLEVTSASSAVFHMAAADTKPQTGACA